MNDSIINKLDKIILYVVAYTVIFITFRLTMPYILPFVLGTIVALLAQPSINFITNRLKIKRGIVGIVVVLFFFAIICLILVAIVAKIVNELAALSTVLPGTLNKLVNYGYKYIDMAAIYYEMLDPAIVDSIKGAANRVFSGSFTAAVFLVNMALNILKSLPGLLMLFLVTLLSSIYIAIDLPRIKAKFFSAFTKEDSSRAKIIILESNKMLGNYLKAYLFLISVTFIETLIGTSILKIKYGVLLSVVTSISDMLPILGPGTVLVPTGTIYIITGDYVRGIGIYILYLIILVVRQVIEPKVVSSSLGIYPLAIIMAIFIGIKAYGFTGMIFAVFLVVFYVVLQKVGVL